MTKFEDLTKGGKKGRIIIRNLQSQVQEGLLTKILKNYGELKEVVIVKLDGKSRGFAFAEFINRNNALKAIKELNNTKLRGKVISLNLAIGKKEYEAQKLEEN